MSNIVQTPASTANYTVSRLGYRVTGIIIHTIVGTLGAADGAFANPARGASAHYGVACDGSVVHQYVAENNIAWHCGRFYSDPANPLANCNTVGIEHCDNGDAFAPRSDAEYACSAQLVREIAARYGIPIDRTHIRRHKEVSVAPTGCPDTLDIDRIVATAAGAPPTPTSQEDDDMLFVGPIHALAASVTAFTGGSVYPAPSTTSPAVGSFAQGQTLSLKGYRFSTSAVQSSDRGAGAGAGPDYIWWEFDTGHWYPDADLDTTGVPGAPVGAAVSTLPTGMVSYFLTVDQASPGSQPDDDSAYATKAELTAVAARIPTKGSGTVTVTLS